MSMGTQWALLDHCLMAVNCVGPLLPWCPNDLLTHRHARFGPKLLHHYLAGAAISYTRIFVRSDFLCCDRGDWYDKEALVVGWLNS